MSRILLGVLGVLTGLWGAKLLLAQGGQNLRATLTWLIAGVVLHDGVLVPVTLGIAALAALILRRPVPPPIVVGFVVLASVTLVAVPVLGRFGAKPDNPTLLDRDYGTGWWVIAGLTLLVVAAALLRRRLGRGRSGTRAGS